MVSIEGPLEVMGYEQHLFEFMNTVPEFRSEFEEYAKDRQSNSGSDERRRYPAEYLGSEHPILVQLYNAREAIDTAFRTGELEYNDQVVDTITIGRAIKVLDNTDIVSPSGDGLNLSLEEVYAERLWEEEDYWDTVFELELAAGLVQEGLEAKLVEEGEEPGPDVIVESEGEEVWIECKRKRPKTLPERKQETAIKRIIDRTHDRIALGDDSLAVEIRSDSFLYPEYVDDIVDSLATLIEDGQAGSLDTVEVSGHEFEIELVDYSKGMEKINLRPEWIKLLSQYIDISSAISPFSHLAYDIQPGQTYGHAESNFKISDGTLNVANAFMLGVDSTAESDYVNWVMGPIEQARKKLSGHEPSIIAVDVPNQKIEEMAERCTLDHKGEEVTLTERLDQRIVGQLAGSDTINAITISSRIEERHNRGFRQGRLSNTTINIDPGTELPDEIRQLFEN